MEAWSKDGRAKVSRRKEFDVNIVKIGSADEVERENEKTT